MGILRYADFFLFFFFFLRSMRVRLTTLDPLSAADASSASELLFCLGSGFFLLGLGPRLGLFSL